LDQLAQLKQRADALRSRADYTDRGILAATRAEADNSTSEGGDDLVRMAKLTGPLKVLD
jgi:hypothetical protein